MDIYMTNWSGIQSKTVLVQNLMIERRIDTGLLAEINFQEF